MGSSIAGKSIEITCTIFTVISGLVNMPRVAWTELSPDHNNIMINGQNMSSATLVFRKLSTSHGKNYTCQGMLTSPALSAPYVLTKTIPLIVNGQFRGLKLINFMFCLLVVSTPRVNITIPDEPLYAGMNISVDCNAFLSTSVDSDVTVNIKWFNGSMPLSKNSDRVSISPLSGERPSFTSTLYIIPLYDVDNATTYRCRASANSDSYFIGSSDIGESSITISVHQRSQYLIVSYSNFYLTIMLWYFSML